MLNSFISILLIGIIVFSLFQATRYMVQSLKIAWRLHKQVQEFKRKYPLPSRE